MTARRVRVPGNNPETRIYCDWTDRHGSECPNNINPPADWDAKSARRRAREYAGWKNRGRYDYCAQHAPEWAR